MAVANDPARQGKTDPPPFLLGGETRVEDLVPDLTRYSRTVVSHAHAHPSFGQRDGGDVHAAIPTSESVDCVFRQGFERPLEQNFVALDDQLALVRRRDRHALRESRHPGAKVRRHPVDQLTEIDRLLARRPSDALEAVRDPLEPFEIGLHVIESRARRFLGLGFAQELDPAADARERSTQLVRRFPRHARPDLLPIRATAGAQRVRSGDQYHADQDRLQKRNENETADEWSVAEVHGPDPRLDDRDVLPVELEDVVAHRPGAKRRGERNVGSVGRHAFGIGEDHRQSRFANVSGQIEKRAVGGVGIRIAETVIDTGVHQSDSRRFLSQLANNPARVDDVPGE